jgi:hypothetical protein
VYEVTIAIGMLAPNANPPVPETGVVCVKDIPLFYTMEEVWDEVEKGARKAFLEAWKKAGGK